MDKIDRERYVLALVACNISVSIDDLNLTVTFRTSREEMERSYSIAEPLPADVLAFIHFCEER